MFKKQYYNNLGLHIVALSSLPSFRFRYRETQTLSQQIFLFLSAAVIHHVLPKTPNRLSKTPKAQNQTIKYPFCSLKQTKCQTK